MGVRGHQPRRMGEIWAIIGPEIEHVRGRAGRGDAFRLSAEVGHAGDLPWQYAAAADAAADGLSDLEEPCSLEPSGRIPAAYRMDERDAASNVRFPAAPTARHDGSTAQGK